MSERAIVEAALFVAGGNITVERLAKLCNIDPAKVKELADGLVEEYSRRDCGVEVFKAAEIKAARIQDDVRHETHVRKTGQPEFLLDGGPPKSRLTLQLRERYATRARKKVIEVLAAKNPSASVPYSELFCEAMAFPLVTPDDLESWLRALEPNIEIRLAGSSRRRKLSTSEDDNVLVRKPDLLR